jgi:hypothetical protein
MRLPARTVSLRLVLACGAAALAPLALGGQTATRALPQRIAPETLETALVAAWDSGFGAWVEELAKHGREGAALDAIALHRTAALRLVEHLRASDHGMQRKLAVMLAGYLGPDAPAGILDALFEAEAARDRAARQGDVEPRTEEAVDELVRDAGGEGTQRPATIYQLYPPSVAPPPPPPPRALVDRFDAQSVVEDVVDSGIRWCGQRERRQAGASVLRRVVERTVAGEYWNASATALEGLVCVCVEDTGGARQQLRDLGGREAARPSVAAVARPRARRLASAPRWPLRAWAGGRASPAGAGSGRGMD